MGKVAHKIFDAQVEKIRKTYSHRRDRMLEAMTKYMPAVSSGRSRKVACSSG